MSADQGEEQRGKWKQKQVLGQGGFGCVELWHNEATGEQIAVKKCKFKEDISAKVLDRWKMEVYIMGKLNHENVIRAVSVSQDLVSLIGKQPVLAMEFCEGGDLRKVLTLPENCYGLPEKQIRELVTGVGSAIEYLHNNRIIHRDLKPENIVLKHVDNSRTLYKIIDLGYAKELDINSICDSFVGTVQYLAPELFISKPYTKTVDYWSFGSLVFECITGFRPFLPTTPPVEWHAAVCKKSPDDISAQYDANKQIKFSKKLPFPNQLCRAFQNYFEQWLRLMLRWDPRARGGGIQAINGVERPKCFYVIEHIMATSILHILHVEANNILSYPVNETSTKAKLQEDIEKDTGIAPDSQDIILANGVRLISTDMSIQECCSLFSEDPVVFLFGRGPMQTQSRRNNILPVSVQAIVKDPNVLLPPKDHRKTWAQAVYWFTELNKDYKRLILSHRAALLSLLRSNSMLSKLKTMMVTEGGKLQACQEQFKESLDLDIKHWREVFPAGDHVFNGVTTEVYTQWTQMLNKIEAFNDLNGRVKRLDNQATTVTSEVVELQRSPFTKTKESIELEDFEKKARELYGDLLKATHGDSSRDIIDHHKMVELVGHCYLKKDEVTGLAYKHLSKVMECQHRLDKILPEMEMACEEIEAARKQLISMQCRRQTDLWNLLRHSVVAVEGSEAGVNSLHNSQPILNGSYLLEASLLEPALESMKLMDESKTNTQRLQEMLDTVLKEQEESLMFFSSLDSKG